MFQADTLSLQEFPPVGVDAWRAAVEQDLEGAPFDKKLVTRTYEGLELQPLYTAADAAADTRDAGLPGLAPFTRGATPLGGRECGWDIRQEVTEPNPADANAVALEELQNGVTSILLRFDAAGRSGIGPRDIASGGLVGRDGVALHSLADLNTVLDGVYLDIAPIALEAGGAFFAASALLIAAWRDRGVNIAGVRGAFNADPFAVLARDGRLPMPLDAALDAMASLAAWADRNAPRITTVRVGSAPYHHAGATAVQDLAFAVATGAEYLRALTERGGLSVAAAARQMQFSTAVGTNLFLAVAKLRAARRLWSRVLEVAGVPAAEQPPLRLHVRTSKRVITKRDPWVNILRNTVCAFAAGIAGAESITTVPYDAAVGLPTEHARRVARNTQHVLLEEAHLTRVVDPAGGSYAVERLTGDLARRAWNLVQEIERRGGMRAALTSGWVRGQIDSAFSQRLRNLSTRRDAVIGVSEFPNAGEAPLPRRSNNPLDVAAAARARLAHVVRTPEAPAALVRLTEATARGVSPAVVDLAVRAAEEGATLAELHLASGGRRDAESIPAVHPHPYAQPFEDLRDAADAHTAATGERPAVFLASIGPVAQHTARTNYSQSFFEAGGFRCIAGDGYDSAQRAVAAFAESRAHIAVICSSDKAYPTLVPDLAPRLHAAGARTVILAGHPGEHEAAYRAAGVDRFIFVKCDVVAALHDLLAEEGVAVEPPG